MNEAFISTLDETTERYVREALADTNTDDEVRERLADATRQAAAVAQDVEAGASASEALAFTREFDSFLNTARTKALGAKRLETEIEAKETDVAKAWAEIEQLSASMPALAVAVNRTLDKYEEARHDYNTQEFKIATVSTRLSMRRAELAELRRQLARLKTQEVQR